jgi:hypothetical protein
MPTTVKTPSLNKTINCEFSKTGTSYRGFSSIDQEMEREIAMTWFTSSEKTTYSQRNFLLKKDVIR